MGVSVTYMVSVNGGGATSISPTTGIYGAATNFTLNDNSVGGGDVTVTITDAYGCDREVIVTDPASGLPVVVFTAPADLCIDAGVITGLSGGTPVGGVYSGAGVTDDSNGMTYSFDPAAAGESPHTLTYTFTAVNSCSISTSDDVTVFGLDYGDLLSPPYPTVNANGAATHCVPTTPLLKIGALVDTELDGQPSSLADGDGADEDGFVPGSVMFIRGMAQDLTIPVMNMTGNTAKLTVFIDWNNDGNFGGTNEMYSDDIAPGDVSGALLNVIPPAGAVINTNLAVRFRLSTDMAAVMNAGGPAPEWRSGRLSLFR